MINWIRPRLADALTSFRLLSSLPLFVLIVFGQWTPALALLCAMALSDALDGWAARKWKPADKHSHDTDTRADGAMCFALVTAMAIRFVLADWNSWPEAGWPAAGIITVAVLSGLGTMIFIWLTNRLKPALAEYVDVLHGIYYVLIVVTCMQIVAHMAFRDFDQPLRFLAIAVLNTTVAAVLFFKKNRQNGRPDAHYPGSRTWKTLFSRV